MRDELVVESAEQLRALAHPVRMQILDLLTEGPRTNKQLATVLGEPPARLHFHVRELYAAGLIELVEERPKGGVIEKYYRAAARHIRLHTGLGDRAQGQENLPSATFAAAGKELARAVAYFQAVPPGTYLVHEQVRLSEDALARMREHLRAIDDELKKARERADNGEAALPVALTYLLHPVSPDQVDEV